MIIKGGKVFQEDGSFLEQAIYINDHRLVDKAEYQDDGEVIDAEGLLVLPGLVDIHSHGAAGEDFSDGNPEGLKKILQYEKRCGITSYCPTSMTFPKERLRQIFASIKGAQKTVRRLSVSIWKVRFLILPKRVHMLRNGSQHRMWHL